MNLSLVVFKMLWKKRFAHKRMKGERGIAMLIGLIIVVMLATLGLGLTLTTMTEKSTSHNFRQSAQSLSLAESAVQLGIYSLRNIYRVNYLNPVDAQGNNVLQTGYTVSMNTLIPTGLGLPTSMESGSLNVSAQLLGYSPGISGVTFPSRTYRVSGRGRIVNSRAQSDYETIVRVTDYQYIFPLCALCTPGPNTGSGPWRVNPKDENDNPIPMLSTMPNPYIQRILEDNADITVNGDLTNANFGTITYPTPPGESPQPSYWKKYPTLADGSDGVPWIIVVNGNFQISGNRWLYGVVYVKGSSVDLSGSTRLVGILYAPNVADTNNPARLNGTGNPSEQTINGAAFVGPGGVRASGNHADVRRDRTKLNGFFGTGVQVMNWSRKYQ